MGGACSCMDKADKEHEKSMMGSMGFDSVLSNEFKENAENMGDEVKEIYLMHLRGEGNLVHQIRVINKELSDSHIGSLALIVPLLTELNELLLKSNRLTIGNTVKVLESLEKNEKLEKLWINDNNISDEDLQELCPVIIKLQKLQFLHLDDNKITRKGCKILAEVIENLPNLKGVSVKGNNISKRGLVTLAKAIKTHESMDYFYFSSANLDQTELKPIKKLLIGVQLE